MKTIKNYESFFFDFDGVLADSVEVKTRAFAKMFEPYGPEIKSKVIQHHRENGGMARKEKFRYYYSELLNKPIDDNQINDLCNSFSSLVVKGVITAPEIPGTRDFLKKWYLKIPCFVVSATPDDEIQYIIRERGLEKYFREILGSKRSKTDNLIYLLEKYEYDNMLSLFFGDAKSDYIAAKNCKVQFIGILNSPQAPLIRAVQNLKWYPNFLDLREKNLDDF